MFYDISPLISEATAVFPGDTQFSREVLMSFEGGDHLTLSNIKTTVHIGAHADAPNHYRAGGLDIASRSLDYYIGPAQVIRVTGLPAQGRILPAHVDVIRAERVLFATDSFPNPDQWTDDFNALSPELVHHLADAGVRLIGIDTPSVDPAPSKVLESHQAIADRDLAVLEGIVLNEVPEGLYTLMAAPLKLAGADAAPVRAVLTTAQLA